MSDLEIEKVAIDNDAVREDKTEKQSAAPEQVDAAPEQIDAAPEVIRCAATREDTDIHLKYLQAGAFRLFWALLLLVQLGWILPLLLSGTANYIIPLAVSAFIVIMMLSLRSARKKQVDLSEKKNPDGYSEYTLYDGYLEYRDYDKEGNVITFYRVTREEVEMATALPELYVFRKGGISFSVRRSLVPEGSRYFDIVFPNGVPEAKRTVRLGKGRIALPTGMNAYIRLLTVVCVVATLVSLLLFDTIGNRFWIPFLLLVFPIGLLALVLYSAHKRERVRVLPIVCSLLCGAILLLQSFAGMIGAIGAEEASYRDEVTPYFEAVGIDMPSFDQSYHDEYTVYDEETRTFIEIKTVSTYLDEDEAQAFYSMITADRRWLSSTESALYKAFEDFVGYSDVYLVYNVTEDTVNALPATDAACEYVIFTFTGSYPTLNVTVFEK